MVIDRLACFHISTSDLITKERGLLIGCHWNRVFHCLRALVVSSGSNSGINAATDGGPMRRFHFDTGRSLLSDRKSVCDLNAASASPGPALRPHPPAGPALRPAPLSGPALRMAPPSGPALRMAPPSGRPHSLAPPSGRPAPPSVTEQIDSSV